MSSSTLVWPWPWNNYLVLPLNMSPVKSWQIVFNHLHFLQAGFSKHAWIIINTKILILHSGGSKGGHPTDQNFLNFMHFLGGKTWQICMLAPPAGGFGAPPTRNPGSAPAACFQSWAVPFRMNKRLIVLSLVVLVICSKLKRWPN